MCRAQEKRTNAVKDWQLMSRWNSILRLRSREFWCAASAHIQSLFDRIDRFFPHCWWPFARSPNRGSLVLESTRISVQQDLVDTIVNTGGNSCKKFKPSVELGAESFLLPCLRSLCFSLRARASCFSSRLISFFVCLVWSGLDNCFELLFCPESVSHITATVGNIIEIRIHYLYICVFPSVLLTEFNENNKSYFFIEYV